MIHAAPTKTPAIHPWYRISQAYEKRFGTRTIKIPVSLAETCPNRMGLKGMKTCIFCDEWGSAAYPDGQSMSVEAQIAKHLPRLRKKYGTGTFLVYFQAYTNTFVSVKRLETAIESALKNPQIAGFIIGTRPDCLAPAVFDLCRRYQDRTYLSIELGVQSFDDRQLVFFRRGHTAEQSVDAILKIKSETQVDLGIHLIFGCPGETLTDIEATAVTVSRLPVDSVKLHNLHVLRGTELETVYEQGKFKPLSLEAYTNHVIHFLEHLRPDIAIHRVGALSMRWEELVAPEWTRYKLRTMQFVLDEMNRRQTFQGRLWKQEQRNAPIL